MEQVVPGCIVDPGKQANYRSGRTSRQLVVQHFTVGTDSRALIRDQGLAAFLVPKQGAAFQFAPADAVTAHACEWNRLGGGIEYERLSWDEPLTADQLHWGGVITRWYADNYGIPLVLHDGPRLPIGSGFRGSVNHGSLVHRACDQHTDGITQQDFAAMVGGSSGFPNLSSGGTEAMIYAARNIDGSWTARLFQGTFLVREFPAEPRGPFGLPQQALDWAKADPAAQVPIREVSWAELDALTGADGSKVIAFLRKLFPSRSKGK